MRKLGILQFPGTNCDRDIEKMAQAKGFTTQFLWHKNQFNYKEYDVVIVPGGFSFGDYLRSGALAAHSPVMSSLKEYVDAGRPVMGICNGFQILTEAGLLPGVLVKNHKQRFIDGWVDLQFESQNPFFAKSIQKNISLPIAHGDGCYYLSEDEIKRISDNNQIWLKYKNNPNGSAHNIAGVMNKDKNVVGLMPHPERALFDWMGGTDGWDFL